MNKRSLKLSTLLFLVTAIPATMAAQLPEYYPTQFDNIGVIDRVDAGSGEIVIYDRLLRLPSGTAVHSLTTQFALPRDLRQGMKVGYETRMFNGKKAVAEIWVLPSNHSLSGAE